MNLTNLFKTQAALDEHIMQEHPELQGQNNLDWKLLALQVELGECANEWRGFKKWSNDQSKRDFVKCELCEGSGELYSFTAERHISCCDCEGSGKDYSKNPLLEEYVDCLHFILSIGLELQVSVNSVCSPTPYIFGNDITKTFTHLMGDASLINSGFEETENEFSIYVNHFMYLGQLLGFTWDEVEAAYFEKNRINHARQESGY